MHAALLSNRHLGTNIDTISDTKDREASIWRG